MAFADLSKPPSAKRAPDERQLKHVQAIEEAFELVRSVMHQAEGSTDPGQHQQHQWSSRRMSIAATNLETAEMFAIRAACE